MSWQNYNIFSQVVGTCEPHFTPFPSSLGNQIQGIPISSCLFLLQTCAGVGEIYPTPNPAFYTKSGRLHALLPHPFIM